MPPHNTFIAAIPTFALAIVASVSLSLWLVPAPLVTVVAPPDNACDLQLARCTSLVPGGGLVHLSISPRPVPLLRSLQLRVSVEGLDAHMVEVDIVGVGMNMGYNRHMLSVQSDGSFTAEATLGACITGSMTWQASVMVTTGKIKVVAPFRFVTGKIDSGGR
jgi:hypothetical protein